MKFGYGDHMEISLCYENLSKSTILEQSKTGSHSAVTNLYKNIPELSISSVISHIRIYVKLINLTPDRSF